MNWKLLYDPLSSFPRGSLKGNKFQLPSPITTLFAFSFINGSSGTGSSGYTDICLKGSQDTDKDQRPHINVYHELTIVREHHVWG